ncbi:hypothetical protein CR513_15977, partial [Mucuna pruriens]
MDILSRNDQQGHKIDSSIPSSFPNPIQQNAPTNIPTLTSEMVQQMIISTFSVLGFLGKSSSPWYFYFGASNHMTSNAHLLTNIKKYYGNLKIHTTYENQLPITTTSDISSSLTNVFVSLDLMSNLIVVGHLVDNDCRAQFSHFCNSTIVDYQVWHKRLGHPNSNVLHDMLKSSFIGNKHTPSLNFGKSKILLFPTHHPNVTQPFDIIHSDVWEGVALIISHIIVISLRFIFYTQNMNCFPLSNFFMLMLKPNSLLKSKFFALILEGNIHHTHFSKTKKKVTITFSSSKAKYITLAITFFNTLHIVSNHIIHEHIKHIEIDCNMVCEQSISSLMKLLLPVSSNPCINLFEVFTF